MKPLTVTANYYDPEVLTHFNAETAKHELSVLHDDGLYRHLRFQRPGTSICWFSIITSPGQLMIWGDHGCHAFARLPDMFEFFRGSYVNADYWAEKLIAVDRNGPAKHFQEELFTKWLLQDFWNRRDEYTPAAAKMIWDDIKFDILDDYTDRSTADACYDLVSNFKREITHPEPFVFSYPDVWESTESWNGWDYHFLWNLHAILWGIRQYDSLKAEVAK